MGAIRFVAGVVVGVGISWAVLAIARTVPGLPDLAVESTWEDELGFGLAGRVVPRGR